MESEKQTVERMNEEFPTWTEDTTRLKTPCGTMYLTQGYGEKGHEKCFIFGAGKSGNCQSALLMGIQRLIARAFKNGATYKEIVEDLGDIHCSSPIFIRGKKYDSCLSLIASYYGDIREEGRDD